MHDAGKRREFKAFQRSFLTVALLAMFSDWIQGPYSYALYAFYGFEQGDIAMLYMGGFLSSMVCMWVLCLSSCLAVRGLCG